MTNHDVAPTVRRMLVVMGVLAGLLAVAAAPANSAQPSDVPRWLDSDPDIRGHYETVQNDKGTYYLLPFDAPKSGLDEVLVHVLVGKDGKYVSVYAKVIDLPATTPASAYAKLLELNATALVLARFAIVDGALDFIHECPVRILDREHLLAMVWDTANFVDNNYSELRQVVLGYTASAAPPSTTQAPADPTTQTRRSVVQVVAEHGYATERGSGFVVASGVVLASRHVVGGATRIWVVAPGSSSALAAEPISGPTTDVDACLLRVPGLSSPPLALATRVEQANSLGQDLWVVGFPEGDPNLTVTRGLLAGFTSREGVRCVKTTALVRPGSSGAPVVNARGEVIAIVWQTSDAGLSYGIIGDEIRPLADHATRLASAAGYAVATR